MTQNPKHRKYAIGEYERRFLLDELPPGVTNPRPIVDHYLDGTRLRLRTTDLGDGTIERKLGQKRRLADDDPTAILHTTIYLGDPEFEALSTLPGRELRKTRWAIDVGDGTGSVDVFEGPLDGLIVLEVDLGRPDGLDRFEPPVWAGPEVSRVEAFSGGWLAGRALADLQPWMPDRE